MEINLSLQRLLAFKSVVESRSFKKAAEQIFMSPPAVTSHVQALEKGFEVELLLRNRTAIQPTAAGRIFYQYACTVLEETRALENSLSELRRRQKDEVCVGVIPTVAQYLLPCLLPNFLKTSLMGVFKLRMAFSDLLTKMLTEGKVDIAIIFTQPQLQQIHGLRLEPYSPVPLFFFAAPGTSLAEKHEVTPDEITNQPFISQVRSTSHYYNVATALARHNIFMKNVIMEAEDMLTIKEAVKSSLAMGMLAWPVIEKEVVRGELALVHLAGAPIFLQLCFAYQPNKIDTEPVRQVYEFLRLHLLEVLTNLDNPCVLR